MEGKDAIDMLFSGLIAIVISVVLVKVINYFDQD